MACGVSSGVGHWHSFGSVRFGLGARTLRDEEHEEVHEQHGDHYDVDEPTVAQVVRL